MVDPERIAEDRDVAVDASQHRFHVNFVSPSALSERLTAQSYRPEILDALSDITRFKVCQPLGKIARGRIRQGKTPSYVADGIPCLKTQNNRGILVENRRERWFVSQSFADETERVEVGTVLVNRSGAGSIGRTSVYLGTDRPVTNEELFQFQVKAPHDSCFVCVFLSSWWGKRTLERGINGSTGQLKLTKSYMERVAVPLPEPTIQRAIGNKVRKAERLRELANYHSHAVTCELAKAIGELSANELDKFSAAWVNPHEILGRLDSRIYHERVLRVRKRLQTGTINYVEMSTAFEIATGRTPETEQYKSGSVFVTRVANLTGGGIDYTNVVWGKAGGHTLQFGDVLFGCAGHLAKYVGLNVDAVCLKQDYELVASSEVMVCRPLPGANVSFGALCAFLRSSWGYLQCQAVVRGMTAHAYPEDIEQILVPVLDTSLQESLDKHIVGETVAKQAAVGLVEQVRADIESLINGTLDESTLLAESEAIEQWLADNPSPSTTGK